jgi:hypothetical protein
VGAFFPAGSPAAGKNEVTIGVPSNEVTTASRADAAGARQTASAAAKIAAIAPRMDLRCITFPLAPRLA